jgi:hypothetical protein
MGPSTAATRPLLGHTISNDKANDGYTYSLVSTMY